MENLLTTEMDILNFFGLQKKEEPKPQIKKIEAYSGGNYTPLFTYSFDGEKNPGELGPLIDWKLDHRSLRKRSWDSYLTDGITQTIVKRFAMWVVGKGLRVQSEPNKHILDSENVESNLKDFVENSESRFNLFLNSKRGDYSGETNLNTIANTAFINSIVGGDVLVVRRVENGILKTQLVDGDNVCTPVFGSYMSDAAKRGNKIKDGVEINKRGKHVAFYVKTKNNYDVERVLAKGRLSGQTMAFLVTGFKYKINDVRGIPLISAILETVKKLDRYKEATVGGAEERAKVAYSIEHDQFSDGENPMMANMAKAFDSNSGSNELPKDINGKSLQDNVAATLDKTVTNMPIGAKLKSLESKQEVNFEAFYSPNINAICSTFGIPPEVALMKYDSNYSASRAAIKDWEHTLKVWRYNFGFQFYQPLYDFWLDLEVLKNKIQANGYLTAIMQKNQDVLESYRNARFVGASVPHIDPEKEVRAERLKLGETGASIPLTTAEAATERLDQGDYETNVAKYGEELNTTKKNLDIKEEKIE